MEMRDLLAIGGHPTGTLEVGGRHIQVIISSIESTSTCGMRGETTIVCNVANPFYPVCKGDTGSSDEKPQKFVGPLMIYKVIFNAPATIVLWKDGTKTIVKAGKGEAYDPEKGLAMAITKKALGNEGNYYNVIRKWVDDYTDKLIAEALATAYVATTVGDGE